MTPLAWACIGFLVYLGVFIQVASEVYSHFTRRFGPDFLDFVGALVSALFWPLWLPVYGLYRLFG